MCSGHSSGTSNLRIWKQPNSRLQGYPLYFFWPEYRDYITLQQPSFWTIGSSYSSYRPLYHDFCSYNEKNPFLIKTASYFTIGGGIISWIICPMSFLLAVFPFRLGYHYSLSSDGGCIRKMNETMRIMNRSMNRPDDELFQNPEYCYRSVFSDCDFSEFLSEPFNPRTTIYRTTIHLILVNTSAISLREIHYDFCFICR